MARYYPNYHILKAERNGGDSFIWSGNCHAKESMSNGFRWVLGNGHNINIHIDPWLMGKKGFIVENVAHREDDAKTSSVFTRDRKEWDEHKVTTTF